MKAVLYIRVSDEEQVKEGFSIQAQESFLTRKCQEWGYTIVGQAYIDEGFSAKDMKRPALKKMLNDAQFNLFDVIVFWRLDRFTRKSKDFQKMAEHLEKNNCSFRSATEPYDTTTAIGRFQLELAISLGQLERETTAERVHMVMEEQHRKGKRNGGIAPFGYAIGENGLVPDPDEFELGKRIYDMYRNGFTDYTGVRRAGFRSIAVQLNWEGKLHRGNPWNYNSVRYFLGNPANAGNLRWNYRKLSGKPTGNEIITENTHEAMITQEEFDYIQTIMNRRKEDGKKTTSVHPFSGVLKCGRCGYGMVGTSILKRVARKRYYRCLNRMHFGKCNMPVLSEESVLEAFFEAVEMPDISDLIEKPSAAADERAEFEKEIAQIQKHKEKWQNMFLNDIIDMTRLKQELDQYREREKYLQDKLSTYPRESRNWSKKEIADQLQQFAQLWDKIDNQVAKKNFLYDVFESIVINTDVQNPKGGPGNRVTCHVEDMTFRQ